MNFSFLGKKGGGEGEQQQGGGGDGPSQPQPQQAQQPHQAQQPQQAQRPQKVQQSLWRTQVHVVNKFFFFINLIYSLLKNKQ